MRVSVIITTFDQPEQLEKVLWGYANQRHRDFQLVVADDGSGPATTEVIDRVSALAGLDVVHVWHEHRGFRKTEILNRAILASARRLGGGHPVRAKRTRSRPWCWGVSSSRMAVTWGSAREMNVSTRTAVRLGPRAQSYLVSAVPLFMSTT